jgi:hypothetical protein
MAALMALKGQAAHSCAVALLDSMLAQRNEKRGKYRASDIADAIVVLFDFGDFSRFDLFNSLYQGYDRPNAWQIPDFYGFAHDPSIEPKAYDALKRLIADPDPEFRSRAMYTLYRFDHKADQIALFSQVSLNDSSPANRYDACSYLIDKGGVAEAIEGLRNLVKSQQDTLYCDYAILDIEDINTPYSLSVLDDLRSELHAGPILDRLNFTLNTYGALPPRDSVAVTVMVDSLLGFVQQCASLGWIGDRTLVGQLAKFINEARTRLNTTADSMRVATYITQFQQKLGAIYHGSGKLGTEFVSENGWKFLHHNAQCILDRLPRHE